LTIKVLIRGGGDLASGVALRLIRCGFNVFITELAQPLAVRRSVAFSDAVYNNSTTIEGFEARLAQNFDEAIALITQGIIPVIIDPDALIINDYNPDIIVDGRMLKTKSDFFIDSDFPIIIGLGPGFESGINCHAVIETNRGHRLGRVLWEGCAEMNTGMPEEIHGQRGERVLRSPENGMFLSDLSIGDYVLKGQVLFSVNNQSVQAPFSGFVRGLIHNGLTVTRGLKVGDIDPRNEPFLINNVSDKALAIGGGVLEAILSCKDLRVRLGN
jgi:xanthine dehydrogenase accessory factor